MTGLRKYFLIGGTSHMGKSNLADSLAAALGWKHISADKLARHPGRPWKEKPDVVPDHVAEHYTTLSPGELLIDVTRHYIDNVKPLIQNTINYNIDGKLIIEGSAVMPEYMISRGFENINAVWLTGGFEIIKQRIYKNSRYETKTVYEKALIDKFILRSDLFNKKIAADVKKYGLISIDVESVSHIGELVEKCVQYQRHMK